MPTASEIFSQIHQQKESGNERAFDTVRRYYLNELHQETGRNLILYSTAWAQEQSGSTSLSIDDSDVRSFMEVIHGLSQDELDIILHSPGGSPVATEQVVDYLRAKFNDIRIFVPQAAMSAATLMCCAADSVVMGDHSSLGPIDPQIPMQTPVGTRNIGAHAVLEQFETLLCRLAEYVDGDAIDKAVDGCLNKIQGAKKPEGASGLLQALLGQAAEFRQPRLH